MARRPDGELNLKTLAERIGFDAEDYLELAPSFFRASQTDMEKIETAFAGGDAEQAAQAAHSLRGACANFGLYELAQMAAEVETKARAGSLQDLEPCLQNLAAGLEQLGVLVANQTP